MFKYSNIDILFLIKPITSVTYLTKEKNMQKADKEVQDCEERKERRKKNQKSFRLQKKRLVEDRNS